jgi:hypothetical protein
MKLASEYLAQHDVSMDFNKSIREPKSPFVDFKDKKNIKEIEKVIKDIRPNYPEFNNTLLYKDEYCSMWAHVCEASFETGIVPVKFVSKQK